MNTKSFKLSDIPEGLLPAITSNKYATVWLNGNEIKRIYTIHNRYRIITNRGEYRYDFDSDVSIEITQ